MYILDTDCSSLLYSVLLYPMKSIFNVIMIIGPILLIISLAILFTKLMTNPEEKNGLKKIKNAVMSLALITFIPCLINVVMIICGSSFSFSECWNNVQKVESSSTYIETGNESKSSVISNPNDYEEGTERVDSTSASTVSGEGVQKILNAAKMVAEKAQNEKWTYGSSGAHQSTLESSSQYKTTSCANFVSVILQEAGYLSKGNTFWSSSGGQTHWSSKTKAEIEKNFNIINVNYSSSFELQAGDIVLFSNGLQHTALCAGKVNGKLMWYDGGRGSTKDHAAGSVFTNMYRSSSTDSNHKYIRQVFRLK